MPLLVGLILTATFVWLAENLGTFTRAWTYPSQNGGGILYRLKSLAARAFS
jgi:uncharacterized membrane protein YoaT (DUF817 family)